MHSAGAQQDTPLGLGNIHKLADQKLSLSATHEFSSLNGIASNNSPGCAWRVDPDLAIQTNCQLKLLEMRFQGS